MVLSAFDQSKYFGSWLDSELTFKPHTAFVLHKIHFGTRVLFYFRNSFTLKKLASQFILPIPNVVASKTKFVPFNTAYNNLCRVVLGCSFSTHNCDST